MIFLVFAFSFASVEINGQVGAGNQDATHDGVKPPTDPEKAEGTADESQSTAPTVWIHLVGGGRIQVDDVTETTEGLWYSRGNVSTFLDGGRVVRIERSQPPKETASTDSTRSSRWSISDAARVENFFLARFKKPLPLTAFGQSELHTRWGLDHRQGMDVALHPDSVEGQVFIEFLLKEEIPFQAFRGSVPGVATGPHIHVGKGSPRFRKREQ